MINEISHEIIENRTICPIMKVKEDKSMEITATELKKNLGKYLEMAEKEDILITKNGKVIAILKNPKNDIDYKIAAFKSMIGSAIPPDGSPSCTLEEAREERLKKHEYPGRY